MDLARAVTAACEQSHPFRFTYPLEWPIVDKLTEIVRRVYGGDGVELEPRARRQLEKIRAWGFEHLPICIAKTPYSFSHDPTRLGRPRGFRMPIREVRLAAGAGYVYALAGEISTMPGLPREPAARRIDVTPQGMIVGID
jgi:formate--tetrahydrofolate ligase